MLTGVAVTAAIVLAAYFLLDLQAPELHALDLRWRHCNNLEPSDRIVHVDIDDGALERFGRWPWKRRRIADLIRVISELKPEWIMVDFLFSEPEDPYWDDPSLTLDEGRAVVGTLSAANRVFGDLEMAEAIRDAGNVIMAVELDIVPPGAADSVERRVASWWPDAADRTPDAAIMDLKLSEVPGTRERVAQEILRQAAAEQLRGAFTLNEEELAGRLGCDAADVAPIMAGVKRSAARRLVGELLNQDETISAKDVLSRILGDRRGRFNADRSDVLAAVHLELAARAVLGRADPLPPELDGRLHRAPNLTPLLAPFARAARDMAAVNFSADSDGTVRRVPPIVQHNGRAILHLGVAAACRILDLDPRRATLSVGGVLEIPSRGPGQARRLPLDHESNLIIHWAETAPRWRAGEDFPHITAGKLMTVVDARETIRGNETKIKYEWASIVAAAKGAITTADPQIPGATRKIPGDVQYREMINRRHDLEQALRFGRARQTPAGDRTGAIQAELESLNKSIEAEQREAAQAIEMFCAELEEIPEEEIAADPELAADAERYRAAGASLTETIPSLRKANNGLRRSVERTMAELRPHLKDKYAFLGYAATAQGDIVTTPIDPNTHGVMCHAHVLNTILQSRPIRPASAGVGIAICILGGMTISFLTSTYSPRTALIATVALLAGFAAVNGYVFFERMDRWIHLAVPMAATSASWAFVTLFRQLTAERDRRVFARELSQYTSPAIAARIAENPEAAQAFKTVQTRDVTCYFSDLAGFTTLAESHDPRVIQFVLNTYLRRMSEVIWRQHGLINKFMGDGIMAFFNPSVDPLPDHARAACESALDTIDELERLKEEMKGDRAAALFNELHVRVGLATGMCQNGDMGSDLKADYTIIGDVVNLGARLEPANKVFGTQIMVAGPTRDAVADDYEFRYLAELQVKGKARTVPVYEIVCRKGGMSDARREYVERFEAGVELYKRRQWDACIVHFTRLLSRRMDDPGSSRYIDACQEFKRFPPEESWRGALELKEK